MTAPPLATAVPLLTADLPGTGGRWRDPEDFVVDEVPAYAPCGDGGHTYLLVEKRGLTTPEAIRRLCHALEVPETQAGYAGLKDKHAVTRQWISLPDVDPARALAIADDDVRVCEASRHGNKLRTGHLIGNRFTITLHEIGDDALACATAIMARLAGHGLPNFFGPQRFGVRGDNAAQGARVLSGEQRAHGRHKRLLISALQSAMFNDVLARRLDNGTAARVLDGDVARKTPRGGPFVVDDIVADQARLDAGDIVVTGPICGPKMLRPRDGSAARSLEDDVFARHGLEPQAFARAGKLARGARRAFTAPIAAGLVEPADAAIRIGFTLPAGSYATVLLREITKA